MILWSEVRFCCICVFQLQAIIHAEPTTVAAAVCACSHLQVVPVLVQMTRFWTLTTRPVKVGLRCNLFCSSVWGHQWSVKHIQAIIRGPSTNDNTLMSSISGKFRNRKLYKVLCENVCILRGSVEFKGVF